MRHLRQHVVRAIASVSLGMSIGCAAQTPTDPDSMRNAATPGAPAAAGNGLASPVGGAQVCSPGDEAGCGIGACSGTRICLGGVNPHWGPCVVSPGCSPGTPPPPPPNTPVECFVFDDDDTNMAGPSDAIYFYTGACIPDGGPYGVCRHWFGRCRTADANHTPVAFNVMNADGTDEVQADAIHLSEVIVSANAPPSYRFCVPGGACRHSFGDPVSTTGKRGFCRLFDDGYTNLTWPTAQIAIYGWTGISYGVADGHVGRKWFGRCEVAP